MSGHQNDEKDVIKTTNDAIKAMRTVALTFVVTILYLGITAASTTHAQLLREHHLTLPLLGAEVPVFDFFRIAPWMVVALHLIFLLQILFLFRELRALGDGEDERVLPSIFTEATRRRDRVSLLAVVVRFAVFLLILLLPLGLLALMQAKFLAYHEPRITFRLHKLPALVELLLCVWLVPQILSHDRRWRSFWKFRHPWGRGYFLLSRLPVLGTWLFFFLFSWWLAVVPGERQQGVRQWFVEKLKVRPYLDVSGQRLVDPATWQPVSDPALRFATLNLSKRDLRGADFSHAVLPGADFRGADLRGASFVGADLRGADFSPLEGDAAGAVRRTTDLTRADFTGAVLDGARLSGAKLTWAKFPRARLRSARLDGADLRRADLSTARLEGASLRHARLTGAVLDGATLECADLYAVDAEGLQAVAVHASRAGLRRARLFGSTFVGADLRASDLSDAVAGGGDFRGADLRDSRGLSLLALDLRRADLGGAEVSAAYERRPRLVDARGVVLAQQADPEVPPNCPAKARARRATETPRNPTEICDALAAVPCEPNLLDPALQGRPTFCARRLDEGSFYDRLAGDLLRPGQGRSRSAACDSPAFAVPLALRALGCAPPRDPVVEEHLLARIRDLVDDPDGCPAFAALAELLRPGLAREPAAAADDDWPPPTGRPRWDAPGADCEALRGDLWNLALGE